MTVNTSKPWVIALVSHFHQRECFHVQDKKTERQFILPGSGLMEDNHGVIMEYVNDSYVETNVTFPGTKLIVAVNIPVMDLMKEIDK